MLDASEALTRLAEGNRRFVSGDLRGPRRDRRDRLVEGQQPFAVILGCSDSRVPAETVFDQGLGDLFVVRVAGNIAAPSQVGSVEFAAEQFGTRLVVVLGHSNCGAITATLQQMRRPEEPCSPNLARIVQWIRPSIEGLPGRRSGEEKAILQRAVRANIRAAANHLRNESDVLGTLIRDDGLVVLGAEYCLRTGTVDFFDGVPENARV